MTSVTQRITQYKKQVGQPRGGLLPLALFTVEQLDDGFGVLMAIKKICTAVPAARRLTI